MSNILIIDDEEKLRKLLSRVISLEDFSVIEAGTCKTALSKLESNAIDIVLCDVKLPDGNGVDFVKEIKNKYPAIEIILMTAYGNIPDGVQAIKNGAFDYITKGDDNNKIIPLLYRAKEKIQLETRVKHLEKQINQKYGFDNILGKSRAITTAIELAKKVAQTDTTVLLLGETGTGKEIFAQSIHQSGIRKNKNFIAVNCAAFSKELLESELFGHKAGAFTGALKDKKGIFEEADNGTIFLDEIGEMNVELQAKLLRVLENGEFIKVGDSRSAKVNVRIIAATNRDLKDDIAKGNFRSDLYYRLSVFQIQLPALRERIEDIGILAEYFTQLFAVKTGKKINKPDSVFIYALKKYDWQGNIREFKNVIERCVILAENNQLSVYDLPFEITRPDANNFVSAFDLSSVEKLHIQKVLNYTNGNKTKAARLLNIGLTTLYRKIEEYHL